MLKNRLQLHHALALLGCLAALICEACLGITQPLPGTAQIAFTVGQPSASGNPNSPDPVTNVTIHGESLTPPLTVKEPDQPTSSKGRASFDVELPTVQQNNLATYQFTVLFKGKVLTHIKYTIDKGRPVTSNDGTINVDVTDKTTTVSVGVMLPEPLPKLAALGPPSFPARGSGKPLPPPDKKAP